MTVSQEALAAYIGLILTIICGIVRMEHRFTRLEAMIESLKEKDETLARTNKNQSVKIRELETRVGHIARAKSIVPEGEAGGV